MANGYSSGKVYGLAASTTATLQYRRVSDGLLVRTLNLTKSVGQAYWTYLTAIEANTYNVTATDTTAGSGNPTQTKQVVVSAGQNTVTDFDIDPSRAVSTTSARLVSMRVEQTVGSADAKKRVVWVEVTLNPPVEVLKSDDSTERMEKWAYEVTDEWTTGAGGTGRRHCMSDWFPSGSALTLLAASYIEEESRDPAVTGQGQHPDERTRKQCKEKDKEKTTTVGQDTGPASLTVTLP